MQSPDDNEAQRKQNGRISNNVNLLLNDSKDDLSNSMVANLYSSTRNSFASNAGKGYTKDLNFHHTAEVSVEDFKIIKVIGRGSFGKVYLVQKKGSENFLAMKTLKKDMVLRKNQAEHTKVERIILEHVDSPFIVKLHFAFQSPERLYFVMDFLNGGELFYHLRKENFFKESRAKFYAAEMILALECLHRNGVIYRDLKPENVLIDSEGHIKITDFGLSKL